MKQISFLWKSELRKCICISLMAALDAILAVILVYPNAFAPSSLLGVATMIQYLLGVRTGYQFLLVNLPLLFFAYFKLDRSHAVKAACYVGSFSAASLLLQAVLEAFELQGAVYTADSPEALFLVAIGYGAFEGLAYAAVISMGGSTGGTDILAVGINRYHPRFNTVWILFALKISIAVASYFVYGRQLLPVIVSVVCGFAGSVVSDGLLRGRETALKFEVITDCGEALAAELTQKLGHGCLCVFAGGMYEEQRNALLICVVSKRQKYDFERILAGYPHAFAYCHRVRYSSGAFERSSDMKRAANGL